MGRYQITFIVDKEKDSPDGKLRMRVRWGKDNRVAVNLGYRITLDKWSMDAQRCKKNTLHGPKMIAASDINDEIQRYERIAGDVGNTFELAKKEPTAEEYRNALRDALGRQTKDIHTAREYIQEYLREERINRSWSKGTTSIMSYTLKDAVKDEPSLTIGEMATESWLEKYYERILSRNLKNRTIKNLIVTVKTFLTWAMDKGYTQDNRDVRNYMPRLKMVERSVVWLSWDKLMTLYVSRLPGRTRGEITKIHAKDMFCFSCFTGLRVSDILALKWSSVTDDGINVVTEKTSKPVVINLNKYSRAILDKYRERVDNIWPEYVFPRLSSRHINVTIKSVFKELGMDEPVTQTFFRGGKRIDETHPLYECVSMHCGRRTFICNALELGIQPEVIMQWTGHSDYDSMKPYIAVSQKAKEDAMAKFDK